MELREEESKLEEEKLEYTKKRRELEEKLSIIKEEYNNGVNEYMKKTREIKQEMNILKIEHEARMIERKQKINILKQEKKKKKEEMQNTRLELATARLHLQQKRQEEKEKQDIIKLYKQAFRDVYEGEDTWESDNSIWETLNDEYEYPYEDYEYSHIYSYIKAGKKYSEQQDIINKLEAYVCKHIDDTSSLPTYARHKCFYYGGYSNTEGRVAITDSYNDTDDTDDNNECPYGWYPSINAPVLLIPKAWKDRDFSYSNGDEDYKYYKKVRDLYIRRANSYITSHHNTSIGERAEEDVFAFADLIECATQVDITNTNSINLFTNTFKEDIYEALNIPADHTLTLDEWREIIGYFAHLV